MIVEISLVFNKSIVILPVSAARGRTMHDCRGMG